MEGAGELGRSQAGVLKQTNTSAANTHTHTHTHTHTNRHQKQALNQLTALPRRGRVGRGDDMPMGAAELGSGDAAYERRRSGDSGMPLAPMSKDLLHNRIYESPESTACREL